MFLFKNKRCSKRISSKIDQKQNENETTFSFRSLAEKIRKLQDALDDRKLAFNALSAKNALLEADLTVAQQQFHEAKNELKKLRIDNEHLVKNLQREHQEEKDVSFSKGEKKQLLERFLIDLLP